MIFLISLALTAGMIAVGKRFLKQHAGVCYLLAAVVSATVVALTWSGVSAGFPAWVQTWVWPVFARGAWATAMFVAVMYAGAVSKGSKWMKTLMPIRGELSILASILTLGHNLAYGQTYFRLLFTRPDRLSVCQLLAAVCSLLMLCIMLPLFVTSFPGVRRKMKGRIWKKLQRLAYGFYGLVYLHVLLVTLPAAQKQIGAYTLTVLVYSVVFLTYGAMRVRKALQSRPVWVRRIPVVLAVAALAVVCFAVSKPCRQEEKPEVQQPVQQETQKQEEPEETPEPEAEQPQELEQQVVVTPPEEVPDLEQPLPPEEQENLEIPETTEPPVQTPSTPVPTEPAQPTQEVAVEPTVPEQLEQPAVPEVVYQYQNGTFTGTGEGFEGTITVSVTLENDVITGIQVLSASDDEPYWSQGQEVIGRILAAQSTAVDTVSGATFSSGGILEAVRAALNSAKNG